MRAIESEMKCNEIMKEAEEKNTSKKRTKSEQSKVKMRKSPIFISSAERYLSYIKLSIKSEKGEKTNLSPYNGIFFGADISGSACADTELFLLALFFALLSIFAD